MRRVILFAAAVGAWAAAARAGDDAYPIRLRREQPGDKTQVTRAWTEVVKVVVTPAAGEKQTKEEKKGVKLVYTQEVVARPAAARRAAKLVRAYETAERVIDGKAQKLAYEGKKVTIEKKGARYTFVVDGEELQPADAEDLEREFNQAGENPVTNDDFLPRGPVRLNEAWEADPGPVLTGFAARTPFTVAKDAAKVAGKLTKVYDKGGARYGLIELAVTLPATGWKQGEQEWPLKAGSRITVKADLDVCIDGSAADGSFGTAMSVDLRANVPGGGSLELTAGNTGKMTVKPIAKK